MKKNDTLKKMICTALFSAIAFIFVFVFRISGIGGFLTFDAKDAIMTLCGLFFGPVYGLITVVIATVLEAVTISTTGPWGLLMNFLSSAAFVVSASVIYKYVHKMKGAIIGLCTSVAVMTVVMVIANIIITPIYMHVDRSAVISLLPKLLIPFNLTKSVFNAAIVLLLYKPLSTALKKARVLESSEDAVYRLNAKTIVTITVAVVLIVTSVLVLINVLGGSFEWVRR